MKRWVEGVVFVAVAVLLHLVVFASPPRSGQSAGGSGGETMISIEAAAQTVAKMVDAWEAPPKTQPKTTLSNPQAPATSELVIPEMELSQAPRAQMAVALAQPQKDDNVEVDTTTPPTPRPKPKKQTQKPAKPQPRKEAEQQGRKAEHTSAGRKKEVAAGTGGGSQAGAGSAAVATGNLGKQAKLEAIWGAKIRARIERYKRYPRGADATGVVRVGLTVSRDGRLLSHRLSKSSGNPLLDKAALATVARAKKVPKAPKGLPGDRFSFTLNIRLEPR